MLVKSSSDSFRFTNRVLQNLPVGVLERLRLQKVNLRAGRDIEFPGTPIPNIFFLESGVALMTTTFEDGSQVEVGLFGFESVLGVSGLMGTRRSLNRVYMLFPGHGFVSPMPAAMAEFQTAGPFQNFAVRAVQAQLAQVAQSAGCNAKHDVEQRMARWLLLCVDRSRSSNLTISQESLGTMLGIRRMSAGVAIRRFTDLGLIDHRRGGIQVLNAGALEAKACECYRTVKRHLENSTEFDSGVAP